MRLPEYMTITLSPADKADLTTARSSFIQSMNTLDEQQKLDRAKVIASGLRTADPYTRAMAKQIVDADKAQADVKRIKADLEATQRDLAAGGHRPKDPHWRGAALERKEQLTNELAAAHARLIALAEGTFENAQRKAAVEFRERRQKAAKTAALKEAVERAQARLDQEAIELKAESIARARRANAGRPAPDAGESQ